MKKLLMAAAISAALVAGSASAQTYLGAGVGASKTDSSETSWKLYGGFQFNPTWGLELGYTDLGHYRGSNIESWSLAGTGTLPLGAGWSLIGKLGAAANRPRFGGGSNHTDLLAGVGVGYSMTKNLGLRLEYEDFGKLSNVNNGNNSRGTNLGLSLTYAF
jgi:OmpA-OmpF porin, OOP family